ncbi:ribosylglycohydrolase [Rhodococcus sp. Leaf7]|uniref:ADP-ribosylglycohydrolase family protein n=1 Tax=unclassified Rhodococcus (in: high G+C Gram-positive bacteria) TaxID=192944 RepID=UPI0006FA450E|nr:MULTISPECIES: ADP-ribosylglycohydrolase family protein [unclassified Rhodococcus (in: high G+C Gram-positive bacteria)]KQU03804.1 ribosylglycohydrolase [Rhodococcus sp. Leaf7]KQU39989.1 ribosylglycohydrolase [Rhodococcus sp. Leaf247]
MKLTSDQMTRAQGVLVATAAGDALGAGYEFGYPTPDTVIDMIGGGPFDWAPGEWTDDTSMAVCIADALVEGRGLDGIAENFVAWIDTKPADVGNQTRAVLSARSGSAAEMTKVASGIAGRTGGNGSLMRTAPVALAFLGDADALADASVRISALTHSDPQAGEACALWTAGIRHAVLYGNYDGIRASAGDWAPLLDAAEKGTPADFANNGWVVHALQTAWWAISTTEEDDDQLTAALEKCVRAGGDTDTTAAIAGGLLGARWGVSAVPDAWISMLHGYPGRSGADLVGLARRLVEGAEA